MDDIAAAPPLVGHDFFDRARARLKLDVPAALDDVTATATRGDIDQDPELWKRAGVAATRPAAVLVPVVDRPDPAVLLTQRTADLASHAGQVAFPGGKIEPHDKTPAAAAMREAKEEIGLSHALIEPIGYLDLYLTFSGFRVLPTVARVAPDYRLTINPAEVAEAFEVPLSFVLDPANHRRVTRTYEGRTRTFYVLPFENRFIWGATAGMLVNLAEVLAGG